MCHNTKRLLSCVIYVLYLFPWRLTSFLFSIVPMWAVGAIVVVVLTLVACFTYCMFKKCFSKKKKSKKARERKRAGRRKKEGTEGEGEGEQKVQKEIHKYNLNVKVFLYFIYHGLL